MTKPTRNETLDQIEALIDRHQLTGLCDLIAEVCSAKADHVVDNWQDDIVAEIWNDYAAFFIKASLSPDNIKLKEES
jgi:hypothetical protein